MENIEEVKTRMYTKLMEFGEKKQNRTSLMELFKIKS